MTFLCSLHRFVVLASALETLLVPLVALRHVLKAVREGGIPVDHPYNHHDDQNCIVCYIYYISIYKQ